MTVRVQLQKIVEGLEWQSDYLSAYFNTKTGDVVSVSQEHLGVAEDGEDFSDRQDWEREEIEIARAVVAGGDYLALPDRFEIDEYRMMERFAYRVTDATASARLERAIRGRGAFRYFKDSVHELGLAEEWYAYRDRAYEEIAIEWCEANGIEYTRDQPARQADA